MSEDTKDAGTRLSLARWSQRKRAIARGEAVADAPRAPLAEVQPSVAAPAPSAGAEPAAPDAALPAVESLTFDSDFTVFMTGKVDESVKRAALRRLLHDPRFNVMDGLDVYIDDYSIPDPISPSMVARLQHSIAVLNPVFPGDENTVQVVNAAITGPGPIAAAPDVAPGATTRIEAMGATADVTPIASVAVPAREPAGPDDGGSSP